VKGADVFRSVGDRPVHFVGIGGAGMCALAESLVRGGVRVTGCDVAPGRAVRPLERMGVRVFREHDPVHVEGAGIVVVSSAVPGDHAELEAARAGGVPVLKRAEALGHWVDRGRVVAVAGSHGKTTTTAMMTHVLEAGGMDPTGFVGGEVVAWESHLRPGGERLFVVEADEYDRSFHHLHPDLALVTNVEADHLDVYGTVEGVREAFRIFAEGVRPGGTVVACADDPGAGALLQGLSGPATSYGFSAGSVYRGTDPEPFRGGVRFRVHERGSDEGHLWVGSPGLHNARNALGAVAAARVLGLRWEAIREGLAAFEGVRRRFQRLGEAGGVVVVDDYAHHPTEVRAAISAAREVYPGRRLVAVFQPHLYSRTRDFAQEFGGALALADAVWVTEVYPAREDPIPGVSGELVSGAALDAGSSSVFFHGPLQSLPHALGEFLRPGDVCLTMGAGSIEEAGPEIVSRLRREHAAAGTGKETQGA
jgi:UDP-N-acetylmuramate--alanine ligase